MYFFEKLSTIWKTPEFDQISIKWRISGECPLNNRKRGKTQSEEKRRIRISCGFDVKPSPQVFSAPRIWSDIAVHRREGFRPPSQKKFIFWTSLKNHKWATQASLNFLVLKLGDSLTGIAVIQHDLLTVRSSYLYFWGSVNHYWIRHLSLFVHRKQLSRITCTHCTLHMNANSKQKMTDV